MAKFEISIVDDDESVREAMSGLMRSIGFAANAFPSGESFLKSSRLHYTACLIADVQCRMTDAGSIHRYSHTRAVPPPVTAAVAAEVGRGADALVWLPLNRNRY